ncbi:MAG: arylsulfatase [Zavarzinella sp.]
MMKIFTQLCAIWCLFLIAGLTTFGEEKRPNVLLIITDDQGYGDFSFTGNQVLKTPVIDQLAKESVVFDRFHVSPLCAPTRASLLTGRYSLRTGTWGVSKGEETMRAEEITIAEVLQKAGYATAMFGKWHNGENFPYTPNGQGFTHSLGFNLGHWNNYFDTRLKQNSTWVKSPGFISDYLTDQAIGFIDKQVKPWFCYVSYNTPHSPFQCPAAYFDHYKKLGLDDTLACIYGMCANTDDNVGKLLQHLDKKELRDNTVIIFLTDNGPNGKRFNGNMRGQKGQYYRGGTRVPCLISYGKKWQPHKSEKLAAHIDLYPTIAELTLSKVKNETALDGKSLIPLLEGKENGWGDRSIYIQNTPYGKAKKNSGAICTQQYHYVNGNRGWEVYDVARDPAETTNLYSPDNENFLTTINAFTKWHQEVSKSVEFSRPPIQIGHDQEPAVEMSVAQAALQSGARFSGIHANNAWTIGWGEKGASLTWKIDVTQAGEYEAVVEYLLTKEPMTTFRLTTATSKVESADLKFTDRKFADHPDRVKRTEVYELNWYRHVVGTISLNKGIQEAVLTVSVPNETLEIKSLTLRRK